MRSARFMTYDETIDAWTSQFIASDAAAETAPHFTRSTRRRSAADAPFVAVEWPQIRMLLDETDAERSLRRLTIDVRAGDTTRCIHLWDEGSDIVDTDTIDGETWRDLVHCGPYGRHA